VAVLQGNAKQGSVRGFYPKTIEGSLRFNDDDGAYLSWTAGTPTNQYKWTWSGWVKYSTSTSDKILFSSYDGSDTDNRAVIGFDNGVNIGFTNRTGGTRTRLISNAVFRDPSAWYHIVVEFDSTQATDSNRTKIYVNGEQITSFSSAEYIAQNQSEINKSGEPHQLGSHSTGSYFDGYLAEVFFIDGTAHDADAFGETKNGVWVPKNITATDFTMGTNGFHLTFQDDTEVEAFNTVLYRGNGSEGHSITGVGFKPDLVWIKCRNVARNFVIEDVIRNTRLQTNTTNAELTKTVDSYDSDGFTVDATLDANYAGQDFVAWCWKAGDSNVSNTDGSITSTVRANDTYGFSIIEFTGASDNDSVGHGLSSTPDMVIFKKTSATGDWWVYHSSLGANSAIRLNDTGAAYTGYNYWPTVDATEIQFDGTSALTGGDVIAYCWAEKTGYSKFGSYSGDNSTDGSNETTVGFKPAFVIIKNTGAGENWNIYDNTRFTDGDGYIEGNLFASSSSAEVTTAPIEFTDTGFAPRASGGGVNASGSTYIYAAFADTRDAAFWLDQSGNDNDWQPVNLDHNDTVADSPTDNFATLNPLNVGVNITLSDGNLKGVCSSEHKSMYGTMGMTSGKYYWEATAISGAATKHTFGITNAANTSAYTQVNGTNALFITGTAAMYAEGDAVGVYNNNVYKNGSVVTSSVWGSGVANGDTVSVAFDADTGKIWFAKNGDWISTAATGSGDTTVATGETYVPAFSIENCTWEVNFGQQPFKYDPPA